MNIMHFIIIIIWFCIGCFLLFCTPLGAILLAGGLIYFAFMVLLFIGVLIYSLFKGE